MKSNDLARYNLNNEILKNLGVVENPPVGEKYLIDTPYKFGGKKKKASNSGGHGKAARRRKRFGGK